MAVELFQEFRPQMAIPNAYVGDNLEKPLLCTVCYASFSGPLELKGEYGQVGLQKGGGGQIFSKIK